MARLFYIAEATIKDVERRIPLWTERYFNSNAKDAMSVIEVAILADPTKGKYTEWIIKNLKDGSIDIPLDDLGWGWELSDYQKLILQEIHDNLQHFDLKKSKLDIRDIYKYTPDSLSKALEQQLGLTKSERKNARKGNFILPPGSELALESGDYQVVKITSSSASSLLCSGTEWCTANNRNATDYLRQGPLYLIYLKGLRLFLVHFESDQFMDTDNEPVKDSIKYKLIDLLSPLTGKTIYNDPLLALDYVLDVVGEPYEPCEQAIIQDPEAAVIYARAILKRRWPEAEPIILTNPNQSYKYALGVLKDKHGITRWPEFETKMIGESHTIPDAANLCLRYAKDVMEERWVEAEPIILKDLYAALQYAFEVVKVKWPELEEPLLEKCSMGYGRTQAIEYAIYNIKGRWKELEPFIMPHQHSWSKYINFLWEIDPDESMAAQAAKDGGEGFLYMPLEDDVF